MPLVTRLSSRIILKPGCQRFCAPSIAEVRHYSLSLKEKQYTNASIVRSQITPALLPYTVALLEASRLPRPLTGNTVVALLYQLYSRTDRLELQLPTSLRQINATYDIMDAMATDFAACALKRIGDEAVSTLSPAEHFRFRRAFYRVELYYTLFQDHGLPNDVNHWFFSRHPPWENEQLGCVHRDLETRLYQALAQCQRETVEVNEQDRIDDEELKDSWLSQGVVFIYNLANAPSPEAQRSILADGIAASSHDAAIPDLPNDLLRTYRRDEHYTQTCESVAIHQYGQPNNEDVDTGPYQAWRTEHAGWKVLESFLRSSDWLRDCAYVFWDRDRIQKIGRFPREKV